MNQISVQKLKINPGQMRTTLDLDQLAALAFQIAQRGLDADRPLLVTPDNGAYRVVRGHRRWLAAMVAAHAQGENGGELDLEAVRGALEGLLGVEEKQEVCATCGCPVLPLDAFPEAEIPLEVLSDPGAWRICETCEAFVDKIEQATVQSTDPSAVFTLYQTLPERYPIQVPVIVQEYDTPLAEQLCLIGDNFGEEEPDLLGQALGFKHALEHGATLGQLAAATGLSLDLVRGIAAMGDVEPDFARHLAEHGLSPKIATLAVKLAGPRRRAFQTVVMGRRNMSLDHARKVHQRLVDWRDDAAPGLPIGTPEEINAERTARALWGQTKEADEDRAWLAVAESRSVERDLARLAGIIDRYDYRVEPEKVLDIVPQMACKNCQLEEVLRELPTLEFHPGYPCQRSRSAAGCNLAVAKGDPFVVYVGRGQAGPGAKEQGSKRYYDDAEALLADLAAWVEAHGADEDEEEGTSPVDENRAMIRSFMARHRELFAEHPLATPCATCAHRLPASPVKADPGAPPCTWSKGRKTIHFHVWQEQDGGPGLSGVEGRQIPFCRQYSPRDRWIDLIPAFPESPALPAGWLQAAIEMLAKDYGRREYHRGLQLLERLTGRPLKVSENYGGWFLEQFQDQGKELSPEQLTTLLTWVLLYLGRQRSGPMLAPLPGGVMARWKLAKWPFEPDCGEAQADDEADDEAGDEAEAEPPDEPEAGVPDPGPVCDQCGQPSEAGGLCAACIAEAEAKPEAQSAQETKAAIPDPGPVCDRCGRPSQAGGLCAVCIAKAEAKANPKAKEGDSPPPLPDGREDLEAWFPRSGNGQEEPETKEGAESVLDW